MSSNSLMCYATLTRGQWEQLKASIEQRSDVDLREVSDRVQVVMDRTVPHIHLNIGQKAEVDYYWVSFPLNGIGCSLLRNILSVDT